MKKKIAIITHGFSIGGTERALVNMINILPVEEFDITVYVSDDRKDLLPLIKRDVIVKKLPFQKISTKRVLREAVCSRKLKNIYNAFDDICQIKINPVDSYAQKKAVAHLQSSVDEYYDIAIYYSLPTQAELIYVLEKMQAGRKVAWVHMDVMTYEGRIEKFHDIYAKYDAIVCVSNHCKTQFLKMFPDLNRKMVVLYNYLNPINIKRLSQEDVNLLDTEAFSIFTCSRLSDEKQPYLAVDVLSELIKRNKEVKWYWAGSGALFNDVQKYIKDKKVENSFVLLGNVDNPYPLYKNADLYVQLSVAESFCLSLAEAKILECNCVSTNFPTAYEILDIDTDRIVKSDADEISDAICSFVDRKEPFDQNRKKCFPIGEQARTQIVEFLLR